MSGTGLLRVEKAGPQALLQDAGRFGVRHLGMTQGGPMDWHAAGWANALLGNPASAPVLEIAMGGLTLMAEADVTLALCGADLGATVNDRALAPWQRVELNKGDRLAFDLPRSGMRAYLAAPGGWIGEASLGSVACVTREGLGGHKGGGTALEAGDTLRFPAARPDPMPVASEVPEAYRVDYQQPARLGLIPAGQIAAFDGRSLYEAFNREWQVDTRADRMGIRLTGPVLTGPLPAMVSEGIAPGSVQVPPDGQPICLMNDRQTIGGYPRLGTLSPVARARLAQCAVGHPVRLTACGVGVARAQWRAAIEAITAFGAIRS
ncbi:allophanate hydrolase [Tamilnaduibacter salinus]|uniref:Allophanate hydrolase n=1 Tax=Tamilnaduibacter salinus TaxID=1484056 RepID=A0A2U1CUA3_9GAMM|nr:biotin-dependent carboxyltransferase family protein [Tamilnaduibacter salinus]PVY70665.1 allophanate hydrolase [Tamilnaduibacter salinus]